MYALRWPYHPVIPFAPNSESTGSGWFSRLMMIHMSKPCLRIHGCSMVRIFSALTSYSRRSRSRDRLACASVGAVVTATSVSASSSALLIRLLQRVVFRSFSVPPAPRIRPRRRRREQAVQNLRRIHLVVAQTRDGVRLGRITVPAVLCTITVGDLAVVVRIRRALEELLDQVDGVVEVVVIHVANVDVELPFELAAEPLAPVAAQDVAEVVVLPPVLGHFLVDHARPAIPDPLRIAIRILR